MGTKSTLFGGNITLSLIGFVLFTQVNIAHAARNFWQLPQSNTVSSQSTNSLLGSNDVVASYSANTQMDAKGRNYTQSTVNVTQYLSDASSFSFEYADARDQRNIILGYTNDRLSVSFMQGKGKDYASLAGEFSGVDPYLFHAGFKQDFTIQGYAMDYRFRRFGHVQVGQASVLAQGLDERRARYFEWSNNKMFARVTRFIRGNENIGNGLDVGFAFGRRNNKLVALQAMQLDNNRSMQRLRLQFDGSKSRQYWVDFSANQNALYEANDDYQVMFSFKTLLGTKSIASYQNEVSGSSSDGASDEGAVEDENGASAPAKKKGRGWKRAVFIGVGVAAAAGLSSSGSSSQDRTSRFRTQNEAAFQVLNDVNPRSIRQNREFGGWVYINPDGSFASTVPVRGERASVTLPAPSLVIPLGSRRTAVYHTHAAFDPQFDNENFSQVDLDSDRAAHIDGYLATPGGQFKLHDIATDTVTTLGSIATD